MSAPATVLIVDDEQPLVELLASYLTREGFQVLRAYDGSKALDLARRESPDLIVLDVMLPGLDGVEVCRQLRTFSDAYIIMLTARTEEFDKVVGLSVGADDYVTKPFSPRELIARVRALLRRPRSMARTASPAESTETRIDDLVIDHAAYEVRRNGEPIQLTRHEFEILSTLSAHPGMVYTRTQLIEHIWGPEFYLDDHVIDVHVSNLRRKLQEDQSQPGYIETVRGVGYRFRRC